MNSEAISKLKEDPDNAGWVLGWGVYRMDPWDLQGVYETKEEAQQQAISAGSGYSANYGSHRVGSTDFVGGSGN